MKPFSIDPNVSAQENLWRAARQCTVLVICSAKRRRRLNLNKEEWNDLLDRTTFETVCTFMRKLRGTGKSTQEGYDHSRSFLMNVYACAWSVSGHCINSLLAEIKRRINSIAIEDSISPGQLKSPKYSDVLQDKCYLNYYRKKDNYTKPKSYSKLTSQHLKDKRAHECYEAYVAECQLLGVTPVIEFEYRLKNRYITAFTRKPGTKTFKELRRDRERSAKARRNKRDKCTSKTRK